MDSLIENSYSSSSSSSDDSSSSHSSDASFRRKFVKSKPKNNISNSNNNNNTEANNNDHIKQITINNPKVPKPALSGAIHKDNLYLNLLNRYECDYSKELFVTLLDKAEEAGCKNVIACLDKDANLRPLGFFGFKLISSRHPLAPKDCAKNMILMCYEIEDTDSL